MLLALLLTLNSPSVGQDNFQYSIAPLSSTTQKIMQKYTWHPGCPVPLQDLSYVTLSYWGFDQHTHTGVLIVHKKLAHDVVEAFHQLYLHKFAIERMQPMDDYQGDDIASMSANNTSAFNCRVNTTFPGQYSLHSYGYAIDLNPLINPYIKGITVLPETGRAYLDRSKPAPGMIIADDDTYQIFIKNDWKWGGNFEGRTDYQHFEKNLNAKTSVE